MTNDVIKIPIDAKAFIESLPKQEDGSTQLDEGIISVYLSDLLNAAGIEAQARYQDTDWSIEVKDKKYFISTGLYDEPVDGLLHAVRYFADELNSGNDFEAWYSYSKGVHFLNVKQKVSTSAEKAAEPEDIQVQEG